MSEGLNAGTGHKGFEEWEINPAYGVDPSGDTTLNEGLRAGRVEGGAVSPSFNVAREKLQGALEPLIIGLFAEDKGSPLPPVDDPEYNDFY